jgi:hypothetical protein
MSRSDPHAIVEIDGKRYDSWQAESLFAGVSVELATNQASQAVWKVFDPDFKLIDKYTNADGVPLLTIRCWLGFGLDLGEPVFKGLLARVERGDVDTSLCAYDMGYKMRQQKKTEHHHAVNDLELLAHLAERNGLQFEGPAKDFKLERHSAYMQDARNDWELAMERAQDVGLVLYVRGDTLFAKEPAQVGKPVLTLTYRKDLILLFNFALSYKVPENPAGRPGEVEARGRGRGGKRLSGRSRRNTRGTKGLEVTHDLAIHTTAFANRRAKASKQLQREHAFTCNVRSIPPLDNVRPDVRDTVRLVNVGKLFSGLYICDKVTHELNAEGFATNYDLYRDIDAG